MLNTIDDFLAAGKSELAAAFKRARAGELTPGALSDFEGAVFDVLGRVGRECVRAFLEEDDLDESLLDLHGERLYRKRRSRREIQTFFGPVTITRAVYQSNRPGARTISPLEQRAGIYHRGFTPRAAELVSHLSAAGTSREVEEQLQRWHFLKPCRTVIRAVASEVGELAEELAPVYEEAVAAAEPAAKADCLVVSRDGTMVHVRNDAWRQAEVGSVSRILDEERTSTRYAAAMPDGSREGLGEKLERILRNEIHATSSKARLVYITDGAHSNWKFQENCELLRGATAILDFFHVAEKLSAAAAALFPDDSEAAESWYREQTEKLLEDRRGVERVLQSLRNRRTRARIRGPSRLDTIREAERYFENNRERMRYARYLDEDLPIRSGVIEAACKTIVGQRLKRSGMRWSPEGGQQILNLRTAVKSGRWDAFWSAHLGAIGAEGLAA